MGEKQLIVKVILLPVLIIVLLIGSLIFTLGFNASNHQLRLSWQPPTENQDGSTLVLSELDSYILKWKRKGESSNEMKLPSTVNQYTLQNLTKGEYSISIAAVTVYGTESDPYRIVKTIK